MNDGVPYFKHFCHNSYVHKLSKLCTSCMLPPSVQHLHDSPTHFIHRRDFEGTEYKDAIKEFSFFPSPTLGKSNVL